jgi:hypothetical protein
VGAYFDVLMMAHQSALDQEAAKSATPPNDKVTLPATPAYQAPPSLHLQKFSAHGGGGGFSVDPTQVSNVASAMGGSDVSTLQAGQSAINGEGPMSIISTGGWETGDNLANNFWVGYDAISTYMQQLENVYHETVAALHKTVANYTGTEDANTSAANGV